MTRDDDDIEPTMDDDESSRGAHDEDGPRIEEGYEPDPDWDADERHNVAAHDVQELTRLGIAVSLASILVVLGAMVLGVPGAGSFARGLAVGCTISIINLRILARAAWTIFEQQVTTSLLAVGASLILLFTSAFWVVRVHPGWSLGYGVGLAVPGAAGIVYAMRQMGKPRA